eukprot:365960-Chlamydomonas_euryale.AAC.6
MHAQTAREPSPPKKPLKCQICMPLQRYGERTHEGCACIERSKTEGITITTLVNLPYLTWRTAQCVANAATGMLHPAVLHPAVLHPAATTVVT